MEPWCSRERAIEGAQPPRRTSTPARSTRPPSSCALVVDGDTITSVVNDFPFLSNGFSTEVWDTFQDWIQATHPDEFDVMFVRLSDGAWDARTTPDSLALWTTRTVEYVEGQPTTSD